MVTPPSLYKNNIGEAGEREKERGRKRERERERERLSAVLHLTRPKSIKNIDSSMNIYVGIRTLAFPMDFCLEALQSKASLFGLDLNWAHLDTRDVIGLGNRSLDLIRLGFELIRPNAQIRLLENTPHSAKFLFLIHCTSQIHVKITKRSLNLYGSIKNLLSGWIRSDGWIRSVGSAEYALFLKNEPWSLNTLVSVFVFATDESDCYGTQWLSIGIL